MTRQYAEDGVVLKHNIRFGTGRAGNPLANALMLLVGALAVGAAIVLGFFAFIVLSAIVLILAAIVGVRLWWFRRNLRKGLVGSDDLHERRRTSSRVIEGEYTVISTRTRSRD